MPVTPKPNPQIVAPQVGARATYLVFGIIALCFLTAAFVVSITMLRPHDDNTALIATVAGLNSTVVLGLLAATVQQVHLAVNSRLTQLLELTAKSSRAEGKLEG